MIGLIAPFVIYGFFLTIPAYTHELDETDLDKRENLALMLTLLVSGLAYVLTKNTYLAMGIAGLGLLIWWLI